jgi:hypothetical protein
LFIKQIKSTDKKEKESSKISAKHPKYFVIRFSPETQTMPANLHQYKIFSYVGKGAGAKTFANVNRGR